MTKTMLSSILSWIDTLIFRILPGGFFLWYVSQLVVSLETRLVQAAQEVWISPLYLVAILFVFTSIWWILFPSAFDLRKKEKMDPKERLLVNAVILFINLLSLFFFVPSSGLFQFFVRLGVSLYSVILFSDFLFLCFAVAKELLRPKQSGSLSAAAGMGVFSFFVLALGIPAFGVLFFFLREIAVSTLAWPLLASLFVSVIFQVVVRFTHQVRSS